MSQRLFISYCRVNWSFTCWLVEKLGKLLDANIFVDYIRIAETNFARMFAAWAVQIVEV